MTETTKVPNKTQKTKIIMDTSSWINMFRVELIDYLIENFYIFMTPKIKEEILEGKGFAEDVELFEKLSNEGDIQIISPKIIPEKIKHEISVSSGEIEIISCAMERKDCVVLIDDSRVYRVMDRFGLKYVSSANIIMDAYLTAMIDKEETYRLLKVLKMVLRDEVIDKAMEVLKDVGNKT